MDNANWIIYGCFVLSAAFLADSYPTSIAYERPVHTVVLAFAAAGFSLLSFGKARPALFKAPSQSLRYTAIPLEEINHAHSSRATSPNRDEETESLGARYQRIILLCSVVALAGRVELFRRISRATECTISSTEVFIPLLISIYDSIRHQKATTKEVDDSLDGNIYDETLEYLQDQYLDSRWKYILPALLLTLGCHMTSGMYTGLNSTYICAIVVGQASTVPLMQWMSTFLDTFLAIAAYELCLKGPLGPATSRARGPLIWGSAMATAAFFWGFVGIIVSFAKPEYRGWLLPFDLLFDIRYVLSLSWQIILFSVLCVSAAHCILYLGVLGLTINLTALFVMIPCTKFLWLNRHPYPPMPVKATFLSFIFIFTGRWLWSHLKFSVSSERRSSTSSQILMGVAFLILIYPGTFRSSRVNFHPIDLLIYDARLQHTKYAKYVTQSHSLEEAVAQYRRRYSISPPPGFDIWYEYAQNRSSIIVDQFDQIYEDLLAFRAILPEELRLSTWEMVSNPWNEISGITIRGGVAAVQETVIPTHRWMLEGVAILINSFARFLPDMDLAFNLNDESRVAVPNNVLQSLRQQGRKVDDGSVVASMSWSSNRAESWLPIPDHDFTGTKFHDLSFRNTFSQYGSIGCESNSAARKYPYTSSKSHLCMSCVAPHSLGQFLSNWSLAADACHQPDLAHLHGFYLSPAAFKTSHDLLPVFSQSKPHGFNDILYPSAWNYMDKVKYEPTKAEGKPGENAYKPGHPDPEFSLKENTLFWRGATSEGVSSGENTWRGMTRQRLVHLANNLTDSSHDEITILLPDPKPHNGKLTYQTFPSTAIKDLGLSTDIAIVDRIARCGGIGLHDCKDQEAEFGLVGPSDFQHHWTFRYLFDLDGAGFSGRFLPFLQSRSLPFKTALFREWYDERLIAWRHFVPQDIRLHGVWSTLAYFAGVDGKVNGRNVVMSAHLKEGEMIAEDGREWAGKVLRKEDMEIYFFRLLLEWGRLTDDNRDKLGFSMNGQ